MNTLKKGVLAIFTLTSLLFFTSCEDATTEIETELTIQDKVEILKSSEWLLKGFEDRVMHTFSDGKRFTYYGTDSVFSDEAIPGTEDYTITGDLLTIDFHFGNVSTFELKFSCDNNIVKFYKDGELNSVLYKKDSNYKDCL